MDISSYKELLMKSPFGFAFHRMLFDEDGQPKDYVFLELNHAFEELTGLKAQDVIGKSATAVLPGFESQGRSWIQRYGEVCLTQKNMVFEQYSEALGRWYNVFAHPQSADTFTVVFVDITRSKEIQAVIEYQNQRLELISKYSADWMVLLDENFNVQFSSAAIFNILKIKPEAVTGSLPLNLVHADDRKKAMDFLSLIKENKGATDLLEIRVEDANSNFHWLEIIATNLLEIPELNAILLNVREFTRQKVAYQELKETQAQIKLFAENVSDVLFISDKELETQYVSPSVYRVFGETVEEHLARSLQDRYLPEDLQRMRMALQEELSRDTEEGADINRSRIFEAKYIKTDGSLIDVSMHVSFLRDAQGVFNGILGVTRDVTSQRRTEREISQNKDYIQSLIEAIPDLMFVLDAQGTILDLKAGVDETLLINKNERLCRNNSFFKTRDIA